MRRTTRRGSAGCTWVRCPPRGVCTALIVGSALTYAVGGVVYARRKPNPWPQWFAFHEVFHALVVLGSSVHVVAVWRYVLPLA